MLFLFKKMQKDKKSTSSAPEKGVLQVGDEA